jgi:hypothetical protein
MDPKALIKTVTISSALITSPAPQGQAVMHALRAPNLPIHTWPAPNEHPEKTDPPHGEGSGESPMYGGLSAYSTATVNVSAGVSGIAPDTYVAWLPNTLPLMFSPRDLKNQIDTFPTSAPSNVIVRIEPDTSKHLSNPSAMKLRREYTRRRA